MLDRPYWLVPDGKVAGDAFLVLRDAMRRTETAAVAKVVLAGRERAVVVRPHGDGLVMTTLRTPREVKRPVDLFADIPQDGMEGRALTG